MIENIPTSAVKVRFSYSGQKGWYYVWRVRQSEWQWSALGNSGTVKGGFDEAVKKAREWILNDRQSKCN